MKNYNYNIVKMLDMLSALRWKIEKHYKSDTSSAGCNCDKVLNTVDDHLAKSQEALMTELANHVRENKWE